MLRHMISLSRVPSSDTEPKSARSSASARHRWRTLRSCRRGCEIMRSRSTVTWPSLRRHLKQSAANVILSLRLPIVSSASSDRLSRCMKSASMPERSAVSPRSRAHVLDALLLPADGETASSDEKSPPRTIISALRSDSGRIGVNSMRGELEKLAIIRDVELPPELFGDALAHDLESFRQRVAVETPWELRRHAEPARLTWLAAFVHLRGRAITDT